VPALIVIADDFSQLGRGVKNKIRARAEVL